ncbi:MAG: GTP-binding protein [Paludibacteraceae bacterium]|nr:GTP-binding protein [Paludibacteraceae bacterium]
MLSNQEQQEILRRRTFAIISHPDAGKTTLTEKLLLYGGAIHVAGAVKSNKIRRTATSDWMEIEKQRGISVATSVMGFDYRPSVSGPENPISNTTFHINILDTPGHQDFAEDTFRTLTAVDSAIVVIDSAKGVETQTRRLMEVCRMRKTPVMVFMNKMDREGKDPFDLMDEVERELQIHVTPVTWANGQGLKFESVFPLSNRPADLSEKLLEDMEMIDGVYPAFDQEAYLRGELAPVFYGSAYKTIGVQELLDFFVANAPSPRPVMAEEREVDAMEDKFTAFCFKIHANMDPNHRSCIAFFKICSGKFVRNTYYKHVRKAQQMRFSAPTCFMAQRKETVDEAYAGDIVGLPDTGNFKIGDTLTSGEDLHFRGLPSFSPEMFKYIENADPMKQKQLEKGVSQLMDEGVAQLFVSQLNGRKIIGTVGQLQFEVIQYRLEHEYQAKCRWEPLQMYKACWIEVTDKEGEAELDTFKKRKAQYMAFDKEGRDVFMADSAYVLNMAQQDYKHIKFHFTSEF